MQKSTDKKVVIAIDCMGGEQAPYSTVQAMMNLHDKYPEVFFKLYGDKEQILKILQSDINYNDYCEIIHTDEVIQDHEKPSQALRNGKNSSMRLAIDAVKNEQADAMVSSGNTGALMAISKIVLRTLPGIDRPAIVAMIPTAKGQTAMLDLGANIECSEVNLVQFAIMGSAFVQSCLDIENPIVSILNVGSEEIKGHDEVKRTYQILKEHQIVNFNGFIEGNEITNGNVDVIVTDGFSGNIALKTAEGTANFILNSVKNAFKSSIFSKIGALLAKKDLKAKLSNLDPRMHNGAMLVGLNGIIIKSHGSTDKLGFARALEVGISISKHKINDMIKIEIAKTQELFEKSLENNNNI